MRFGEFLYYSGIIPLRELINSVTWQKQSRPRFGEIAMQRRILTSEQLREVIFARDFCEKLGDAAARLGVLNRAEVDAVLDYQRLIQRKIGNYYLEHNLLDNRHLFHYLSRLRVHNEGYTT